MPNVSVIIPAYNRELFLADAVNSVLSQTYTDFELLIIDDASTDSTAAIAERFVATDSRVRIVRHEKNSYRSGALNTGLEHAGGAYVSILDSDDYYHSDKLERQVAFLEQNPLVDGVYGDFDVRRENGTSYSVDACHSTEQVRERLRAAAQGGSTVIIGEGYIPSCSPLIRRHVFEHIRFDRAMRNMEDLDMWLQILGAGFSLVRLPGSTYTYRRHANQKSSDSERAQRAKLHIDEKVRSGAYLTNRGIL